MFTKERIQREETETVRPETKAEVQRSTLYTSNYRYFVCTYSFRCVVSVKAIRVQVSTGHTVTLDLFFLVKDKSFRTF